MVDWEKQVRGHEESDSTKTWKHTAFFIASLSLCRCVCVCVSMSINGGAVSHTDRKVRESVTLQLSAEPFLWHAGYSLLLSPRQHGRGQYSTERRHYSGQWLGLICHEYKENHFQEQYLQQQQQQQPRIGTHCRTYSVIKAAAGTPQLIWNTSLKLVWSSCTKDSWQRS